MASNHELQHDFQAEVIQASHEQPVLVDFWAEWCGPCRVLGPVLEKLAQEQAERFTLVKIDTEKHQDVAAAYRIQGIPAVKLFVDGEPVAEFTGALPEPMITRWLDEHLPTAQPDGYEQALAHVADGKSSEAIASLEPVLADHPDHIPSRALLSRLLFAEQPERAVELARAIPMERPERDVTNALESLLPMVELARSSGEAAGKGAEANLVRGAHAFVEGDSAKALERWIDSLKADRSLQGEAARRACVALFQLLGPNDPITQKYRRPFSSALF